jgi:hypothetical protein
LKLHDVLLIEVAIAETGELVATNATASKARKLVSTNSDESTTAL